MNNSMLECKISGDQITIHLDGGLPFGASVHISDGQVEECLVPRAAAYFKGVADLKCFTVGFPLRVRFRNSGVLKLLLKRGSTILGELSLGFTALPPIKILFIPDARDKTDGSRVYRCELVATALRDRGSDARVISYEEISKINVAEFDIVVGSRVTWQSLLKPLFSLEVRNKICLIYDTDDLNFVPELGGQTASVRAGLLTKDSFRGLAMRRLMTLARCDGMTGSTRVICNYGAQIGLPTVEAPNAIERAAFNNSPPPDTRALKLLMMSGTGSHTRDFEQLRGVLSGILATYPKQVSLTLLGGVIPASSLAALPNVTHIKRVTREEMFNVISQHHVGLVPYEDTLGNDAKSCLKLIEFGARRRAILASPAAEYLRHVTHRSNGFICRSSDNWRDRIVHLLKNREVLGQVSLSAQQKVFQDHMIENTIDKYIDGLSTIYTKWLHGRVQRERARNVQVGMRKEDDAPADVASFA